LVCGRADGAHRTPALTHFPLVRYAPIEETSND
jgi:hypothetical protein